MRGVWNATIMNQPRQSRQPPPSKGKSLGANPQHAQPLDVTWRDVFDIAVLYRRLVDSTYPVVWLDALSKETVTKGFYHENVFLKGEEHNVKMAPYYDLVFGLMKTMIQHFKSDGSGSGGSSSSEFESGVRDAVGCAELLSLARQFHINQHGFLITTQVPSLQDPQADGGAATAAQPGAGGDSDHNKHDGVILTLTDSPPATNSQPSQPPTRHRTPPSSSLGGEGEVGGPVVFSVSTSVTPARVASYNSELRALFQRLAREIRRNGVDQPWQDLEAVSNIILSLVYYFYNLSPLSRGTAAVAYAVAIGLLMSVGLEVNGKLPHGKLHQFEAMLSGAPDAFILVTRRWMKLKRSEDVLSSRLPPIAIHAPTLRHIMRLLNAPVDAAACSHS